MKGKQVQSSSHLMESRYLAQIPINLFLHGNYNLIMLSVGILLISEKNLNYHFSMCH